MTVCTEAGLSDSTAYEIKLYTPAPSWDSSPDNLKSTVSTVTDGSGNLSVDLVPTSGDDYYSVEFSSTLYLFSVPSSGGPFVITTDLLLQGARTVIETGFYELSIGTVTTVAAGDPATAAITGDFPSQTLALGLPAGVKGDKGDDGPVTTVAGVSPDGGGNVPLTINSEAPDSGTGNFAISASDVGAIKSGDAGILAHKMYYDSGVDHFTLTKNTQAFVDTTHLALTFTAPTSGNVIFTLAGQFEIFATDGELADIEWAVAPTSGSATAFASAVQVATQKIGTDAPYACVKLFVTGLTPGTSYTYGWVGLNYSTDYDAELFCSDTSRFLTMLVEAL